MTDTAEHGDDEKVDETEEVVTSPQGRPGVGVGEEIKVVFDYEDVAGRAMSSLTVNPDARGPTSHSVVTKVQKRRQVMDPRLVGCYCTSTEVQAAIAKGTYDVNKTQYFDKKTGRIYFLVYD
jgi:hypothetical protein